jgi:hypothetical protein
VICTYDANLLTAPLALDILRTHPIAIIGGVLVENAFFTRPDDFIREVQAPRDHLDLTEDELAELQDSVWPIRGAPPRAPARR